MRQIYITFFTASLALTVLLGCSATKQLKSDEYLFIGQNIKGKVSIAKYLLEEQYSQKENRRFLVAMPYLNAYNFGLKYYDSLAIIKKYNVDIESINKKIENAKSKQRQNKLELRKSRLTEKFEIKINKGNWMMRAVGEPPAIYDAQKTINTQKRLREYLRKNGFFYNKVEFKVDTLNRKRVKVNYYITQGPQQKFGVFSYTATDRRLQQIIDSVARRSAIKQNAPYSEEVLIQEREVLTQAIKNSGYFGFTRDYITLTLDTAKAFVSNLISGNFQVKNRVSGRHTLYNVDEVYFELEPLTKNEATQTTKHKKHTSVCTFVTPDTTYPFNMLNARVLNKPNKPLHYQNIIKTQAQLAEINIFRFVNVTVDTLTGGRANVNIYTSFLPKYEITQDVGLVVSQGPPGPFANASLRIRNPFGGFEQLNINGRISFEGQISPFLPDTIYQAREIGLGTSLDFPMALMPYLKWRNQLTKYNTSTSINLSYSNVNRPEYTRNLLRTSFVYHLRPNREHIYTITPSEVNIINTPTLNPQFASFLDELERGGNNLKQSFRQSLVTNMGGSYTYFGGSNAPFAKSRYFKALFEVGGINAYLVDRYLLTSTNNLIFDLQPFSYWRLGLDYRHHQPLAKKSLLALRSNIGLAHTFGISPTLPYEKFYFSGGSNGMRAWPPRRLGPGSFAPERNQAGFFAYTAEQPGEILLEANAEIRQTLFGFFEGALFLDVGNIWTFLPDPVRPGSEFEPSRFYKEVAIGTGAGLRLNFSFLVVRVDMAIKVHDPAGIGNEKWPLSQSTFRNPLGMQPGIVYNLGVGYPF